LEDQISQKDSSLQSAEAKVTELNESLNIQKELLADEIAAGKKNIQNYKILNNKLFFRRFSYEKVKDIYNIGFIYISICKLFLF